MAKIKRLGRGLSGMISGGAKQTSAKNSIDKKTATQLKPEKVKAEKKLPSPVVGEDKGYMDLPVSAIDESPYQARKDFDTDGLKELADSIRSEGLMQPITVRRTGDRYELIAGERRFRACQQLELRKITARVIEASDSSSAVMSLIENLQRRDLNPIEEALGYVSLMDDFSLTQEDVSERVGKARPSIANAMRLLQLNKECQGYLRKGMISFGHAKALLGLDASEQQVLLARRIMESGLSVREAEQLVNRLKKGGASGSTARGVPEAELAVIKDIESRISSHLNTRVEIKHGAKKGKITIEYFGNDDLQRILEEINVDPGAAR